MSKSTFQLLHQWKIIPIAILLMIWTLFGIHNQSYHPSNQSDENKPITVNGDTIYVQKKLTNAQHNSPPIHETVPPEDQKTTLLKEASSSEPKISDSFADVAAPPKTLILYAYSETPNARKNLHFFIEKGLHGMADFVFIFNGETDADLLLPKNRENIRVVRRENRCFDLGTMGEVLAKDYLWRGYSRFITLNASIRGPFLPEWFARGGGSSCWSDLFLSRLTDKVKLVGTTMNCQPVTHVQSMLLATDSIGMSILLSPTLSTSIHRPSVFGSASDPTGFVPCYNSMYQAIHGELGLTELIRSQGYEVDVLLAAFQAESPTTYCEKNGHPQDILYEGSYYGGNVHPYELVFIKANRNIMPGFVDRMTEWHLKMEWSAWDTCGGRGVRKEKGSKSGEGV